jgi:hypothetical protein
VGGLMKNRADVIRATVQSLVRCIVREVHSDGTVSVEHRNGEFCEVLETSEGKLRLAPGDSVLVWFSGDEEERGVIVGRIGPTLAAPPGTPDELIFKARKNLTIECGDGSITLRGDGKILIKGKDLVSRAQRMNRVKGGAVSIN